MKCIFKKLLKSGIWTQPLIMAILILCINYFNPNSLRSLETWMACFIISFLIVLFILIETLEHPNEEESITGKKKALYPKIPKELLHDEPAGMILGKDKKTKKYVCNQEQSHYFIIGGAGSGKSSCHIINSILANPSATFFVVDIKGELSFKGTRYGDGSVMIFNPSDKISWGYNPFFLLGENSTTQEIMETMQTIVASLIQIPANIKDPFWKLSARNLMTGLLIYYYKQGKHTFIDVVDEILGRPIAESIQAVMENAEHNSVEYRYIVQFSSMAEETLGSIVAEVNNHLTIFVNDENIRYAFKDNSSKLSPKVLEEGKSIFLSIREDKLTPYYDILQLIINQTLSFLEQRPEDSKPIYFVIDELPRIVANGKLDRLGDAVRTLRSRCVRLVLVTQSIEALQQAYTEAEIVDLISNCNYVIVLSAKSQKTQEMVCKWCGKYRAKKKSWSGNGKDKRSNISYEDKELIEESDFIQLERKEEAILITPYGYLRVKKVPYYKDKFFKPLAEKIKKHNMAVLEMKQQSTQEENKVE